MFMMVREAIKSSEKQANAHGFNFISCMPLQY